MPPNNSNEKPPPVMTWLGAVPMLILSVLFDIIRFVFDQLWFFGPAIAAGTAAIATAAAVNQWGGFLPDAAKTAIAGVAAVFSGGIAVLSEEAIAPFGIIMAMVTGFAGMLTIGLTMFITNRRIFDENPYNTLRFVGSSGIAEIPLIGSVPAMTVCVWWMYSDQIKHDAENLRAYNQKRVASQQQKQQLEATNLMAYRQQKLALANAEAAAASEEERRAA